MADPKYPVPEEPAYKIRDIRQIQDEDFVSATDVVNPVVEGILESVEYLHRHTPALGEDGKVPTNQLPALGGHIAQATAPSNTNLLWVDTSNDNLLKFYDSKSETWQPVKTVWG